MAADLITAQDLIDRLDGGAEALREIAGDDGTGSYRTGPVGIAITEASEEAYGILLAGFTTNEKVQALVANDSSVKGAICQLTRYALTRWKKEFRLPDGKSVYQSEAREARDLLRGKASGAPRTSAETATNGPGPSSLLRPRTATPPRSLMLDAITGRPRGF